MDGGLRGALGIKMGCGPGDKIRVGGHEGAVPHSNSNSEAEGHALVSRVHPMQSVPGHPIEGRSQHHLQMKGKGPAPAKDSNFEQASVVSEQAPGSKPSAKTHLLIVPQALLELELVLANLRSCVPEK